MPGRPARPLYVPPGAFVAYAGNVGAKVITGDLVSLSWNNYPDYGAQINATLETGLIGSTNLADWIELGTWPYASAITVTISNRPPAREFYRAFNRPRP